VRTISQCEQCLLSENYVDCIFQKCCSGAPDSRTVATHHVPSSGNGGATGAGAGNPGGTGTYQQGDYGELLAIRSYLETPLISKYLVVVYREVDQKDGFILTAYFTSWPSSKRAILWKR
jgi:hypothetical protein